MRAWLKRTIQFGSAAPARVSPKHTIEYGAPRGARDPNLLRPGLLLDEKYRLECRVPATGDAQRWVASHRTIARPLVVEFVERPTSPSASEEELAARFLREARIAASIRHENVAAIVDFGVHRDAGRVMPYLVTEPLEGESLDARMQHGRLSLRDIVEVTSQLLRGLEAVHDAGLIHRDVKPTNVLLTEGPEGTLVRLLGVGASVVQDAEASGLVTGTPGYMSPERAWGKALDPRSDLYSVGAMLYEMLGGHRPFEHADPGVVMQQLATESARPLVDLSPDVPDLCAIADCAVARDPSDRYATAREMHDALQAAATESAIGRATPLEPGAPRRVPWSRGAMLRPVVVMATLMLGVTGGVYLTLTPAESTQTPVGYTLSVPIRPTAPPVAAAVVAPAPVAPAAPVEPAAATREDAETETHAGRPRAALAAAIERAAAVERAAARAAHPRARRTPHGADGITRTVDF